MINSKYYPFWLITIAIFIGLIVPILIQDGMFLDGLLYTSVSKNLAEGLGSFWFPYFSETWNKGGLNSFHEHPPLVFAIQSLFFKLLGSSIYTERIYSFTTACITAFSIFKLWSLISIKSPEIKKLAWLPILFWIIIPVCFWSFQNGVQENTMGIFTTFSIYFSLKGLLQKKKIYLNLLIAGVFIFLASFSKGIPGLFPLGIIGLYWLSNKDISFTKMIKYSLILLLVPVIIYSLLILNSTAYSSLSFYVTERLFNRVSSVPTVSSHFYIVYRLISELLPVIIICAIMLAVFKFKSIKFSGNKPDKGIILLFILIGLSASLPLMLTLVQKGFYFSHSLPFFAIGMALIIAPELNKMIEKIKVSTLYFKVFKLITTISLIGVIIMSAIQFGKTSRNKELITDVHLIGNIIPKGSTIGINPSMWNDWDLQCYLIRHYHISVDVTDKEHKFYLLKNNSDSELTKSLIKVAIPTKKYTLYQSR